MPRRTATIVWAAVLLAAPAHAGPAGGAPTPDFREPRAAEAYEAGVASFRNKNYAEAIASFTKANRFDPNPVFLFNIARAFEEWKKYDQALEYYRRYLAAAPDAADRQAVEDSLPALEQLAKQAGAVQKVELAVQSQPDGARVLLDGREVGVAPLRIPVDAGKHFLAVEKEGFARETRELAFVADPVSLSVTLVPLGAGPPPAPAIAEGSPLAAWILLGSGGALLLGGVATGVVASGKHDDMEAAQSQAAFDEARDSGETLALLADGLMAGGAVGLLAGGAWLLFGGEAPATADPRAAGGPGGTFPVLAW